MPVVLLLLLLPVVVLVAVAAAAAAVLRISCEPSSDRDFWLLECFDVKDEDPESCEAFLLNRELLVAGEILLPKLLFMLKRSRLEIEWVSLLSSNPYSAASRSFDFEDALLLSPDSDDLNSRERRPLGGRCTSMAYPVMIY